LKVIDARFNAAQKKHSHHPCVLNLVPGRSPQRESRNKVFGLRI
jgi:hypothetical protein